jgi:hypothetical protein
VADELELSTLNQAIGNYSPTGQWSTYNTPMEGRRIPSTQDIAFQIRPGSEELNCCSVNAARGFGMISDWALMRDEAGLILNWYGPSLLEASVDGTPMKLTQQTDYPRGGHIALSVDPAKLVKFDLKLRIPHWSANSKVAVNGREVEAKPGAYLSLDREWKAGDKVTIDLDLAPRYWVGERESEGKASYYRGPLLMVLDGPNAKPAKFEGAWSAFGPSRSTLEKGAKATFIFEGDAVEWRGGLFDDAGKARVSIDGNAVETVDQYGPQRGAPFVWKRAGLGPGKHTLLVETLGEKSPESSNTWINVGEFIVPFAQPALRTADIARGAAANGDAKAMAAIDVTDATGKTIRLRDFATAGHEAPYFSWLKIDGPTAVPFNRENPSRTSAAK